MTPTTSRSKTFEATTPLLFVTIDEHVKAVKRRYEHEFGRSPSDKGGWYRTHDWRRITLVLNALRPGGRFLDVGLGAGQFINSVATSDLFDEVHGTDPTRFNKYIEFGGEIERIGASIAELPYPDNHFDVVTCMEVLEHVPDEIFKRGLSELRRVCGAQLIMSVPFKESEPIFSGHRRRFEDADILRYFPDANRVLIFDRNTRWAILEEWHGDTTPEIAAPSIVQATERYRRTGPRLRASVMSASQSLSQIVRRVLRRLRRPLVR